MEHKFSNNKKISIDEIIKQFLTFIFAGMVKMINLILKNIFTFFKDTTSAFLTSSLYYLAKYPDI